MSGTVYVSVRECVRQCQGVRTPVLRSVYVDVNECVC